VPKPATVFISLGQRDHRGDKSAPRNYQAIGFYVARKQHGITPLFLTGLL